MRAAVGPGTDVHRLLHVAQDAAARATAGDQPHLGIVEPDGQVVCGAVTRRLFQPETQGGGTGRNDYRLRDRSFFVGRDPTKPGPESAAVGTAAGARSTALIIAQRGAKVAGRFTPVWIRRTSFEAAIQHHVVVRAPRRGGLWWLGRCPLQAGRVSRGWGLEGDLAVLAGRRCSGKNAADQQHECGRGHNDVRDTSFVHRKLLGWIGAMFWLSRQDGATRSDAAAARPRRSPGQLKHTTGGSVKMMGRDGSISVWGRTCPSTSSGRTERRSRSP